MKAAVLHELTVIGEAASRLPSEFKERQPLGTVVEGRGLRNFVVHEYFGLDWSIVWDTATVLVPDLRRQIASILAVEFPDEKS